MPQIIRTSDLAAVIREELVTLLVKELKYSKEEVKIFTDAFMKVWISLPLTQKILDFPPDVCMTAGFQAAGIDEDKAFQRFTTKTKKI